LIPNETEQNEQKSKPDSINLMVMSTYLLMHQKVLQWV